MSEIAEPLLVINGSERQLSDDRDGSPRHTRLNVMKQMILQICLDYPGLPDVRTLDLDEVEFFYDGIRNILMERTKPRAE